MAGEKDVRQGRYGGGSHHLLNRRGEQYHAYYAQGQARHQRRGDLEGDLIKLMEKEARASFVFML